MPRPGRMLYIVSYDIPDDNARNRLAKLLLDYGIRVQYSVFELEVSPEMFGRVREKIAGLMDPEEDNVRFYPICAACAGKVEKLGVAGEFVLEDCVVL